MHPFPFFLAYLLALGNQGTGTKNKPHVIYSTQTLNLFFLSARKFVPILMIDSHPKDQSCVVLRKSRSTAAASTTTPVRKSPHGSMPHLLRRLDETWKGKRPPASILVSGHKSRWASGLRWILALPQCGWSAYTQSTWYLDGDSCLAGTPTEANPPIKHTSVGVGGGGEFFGVFFLLPCGNAVGTARVAALVGCESILVFLLYGMRRMRHVTVR